MMNDRKWMDEGDAAPPSWRPIGVVARTLASAAEARRARAAEEDEALPVPLAWAAE